MTRSISAENYEALQARRLIARDFIWFEVKDRVTGAPVYDGYWSDVGTYNFPVVDPNTGGTSTRQFVGANTLISVSDIVMMSNLTVQTATIVLSQVADRVNDLVRTYECKQGIVQIFRGMFDPDTRQLVSPAEPRFVGFIDDIPIKTGAEGEQGDITITCTSHTQEMTRSNPDTRSDASQQLRYSGDDFFADVSVVGEWDQWWGKTNGSAVSTGKAVSIADGINQAFKK
jgi:hypothetical protein